MMMRLRYTSHVTRHTSHVTRHHTSHVTRHASRVRLPTSAAIWRELIYSTWTSLVPPPPPPYVAVPFDVVGLSVFVVEIYKGFGVLICGSGTSIALKKREGGGAAAGGGAALDCVDEGDDDDDDDGDGDDNSDDDDCLHGGGGAAAAAAAAVAIQESLFLDDGVELPDDFE